MRTCCIVGCSRTEDDLTRPEVDTAAWLIRCVSPRAVPGTFPGRITDYLNAEGHPDPHRPYYADALRHRPRHFAHHQTGSASPTLRRSNAAPAQQAGPLTPSGLVNIERMTITSSSSTQSSVRVTAFFHRQYCGRAQPGSMDGVQRLPSCQLATASSVPDQ